MNKKTFIIILIISIAVAIFGIGLIAANATPYLNCSYWLRDSGDNYELFSYAVQNINKYKSLLFGGIALTVAGAISAFVTTLIVAFVRKAK